MKIPASEYRIQLLRKLPALLYLAARYYAAFTLLGYGFAKLTGAQFTVLDSELAKPMGDVSGFWLTWYYFGYSTVYASVVAWVQIAGAALLGFRKSALVGALLLLPVMANIICVDVWVIRFPLESGALRNALFVFFALTVILCFHAGDIYRLFEKQRNDLAIFATRPVWSGVAAAAVLVGMMTYTAHEGYWLANVNNRAPTLIDGAWQVQGSQDATLPAWIYFEYNRAYMVVFRFQDGRSETHDFRVDDAARTLEVGQNWLDAGTDVFKGTWTRTGDSMTIAGNWKGTRPIQLLLKRKPMRIRDYK